MPVKTTKIANRDNSLMMAEVRAVLFSGLAVSRSYGRPDQFRITHTKSGFAIGGHWPSAMMAYRFARKIEPLADWTQATSKLTTTELGVAIREIEREMKESLQP